MNLDNSQNRKTDRKLNIKADILIGLSILIILLLLLLRGCQCPVTGQDGGAADPTVNFTAGVMQGDIPEMTPEERQALMQKQTDDSAFTVQAVSRGNISKGSTQLQLTVANPQNNVRDCRFDLLIDGETVYTSPVLQPHTYVHTMELDRTLDPGAYTAIVRYSILSDSGEVTGVTEVEVTVICS